jgi:hypothetical protein
MIQSFRVATTLSAYRVVSALSSTAYSVAYPEGNQRLPLGITTDTVKDTTGSIPVAGPGEIKKLYFNDTVTSGQLVSGDTSGRGVPFVLGAQTSSGATITACYVGVLIGPKVDATGTLADVYIQPGFARGTF